MNEFEFSESHIKKTTRIFLFIVFPTLMLCLVGFASFISGFNIGKTIMSMAIASLMMGIIFAIEFPLINRRLRKMKVAIFDDRLVRRSGKKKQDVLWSDITKVKLVEDPKNGLIRITLHQKNKRSIWLFGFNEMEKIASLIKDKIADDVLVRTKHNRFSRENPVPIVIVAIGTTIGMCIIASGGDKAMDIFAILAALCCGGGILIFRPFTRSSIGFRWPELILGTLSLGLGVYALVEFILTGKVS